MRVHLGLLCLASAVACPAQTGATGTEWPHYGGTYQAWRYSDLKQVDTGNVKRLAQIGRAHV